MLQTQIITGPASKADADRGCQSASPTPPAQTAQHRVSPEHTEPVQCRHLYDKGKEVINNSVQELVGHLAPGQVGNTLQLVVEVQLQDTPRTGQSIQR